jgi:hypothetical protein
MSFSASVIEGIESICFYTLVWVNNLRSAKIAPK